MTVPERVLQRLAPGVGDRICTAAIVLAGLAGNVLLWGMVWKYLG
jgi:hypothetical protein